MLECSTISIFAYCKNCGMMPVVGFLFLWSIVRSVLRGQNAIQTYYCDMGYFWLSENPFIHTNILAILQPIGWSYYSVSTKVHPNYVVKFRHLTIIWVMMVSYVGLRCTLIWANNDKSSELAFILQNTAFFMFMLVAHMMDLYCCSSLLLHFISSCGLHFYPTPTCLVLKGFDVVVWSHEKCLVKP